MYLFTQNLVDTVIDNSYDDPGRKIKEKQESLMKTLENRANVPINPKNFENFKVNTQIEDEDIMNINYTNEPDLEIDIEQEDKIFEELVNNLKNAYDDQISTKSMNIENDDVKEADSIMPINTRNEMDVDSTYSEISDARSTIIDMRERAEMARKEAEESDRMLEMLIAKNEEKQRQLKEAENRSREVEQQLANALRTQRTALNQEIKRTEIEINDSNRRTERNNSKIIEFQDLIKSAETRTNEMNAKISRNEELLNSLSSFVNNDYNNKEIIEEEITEARKIG